MKHEPSKHKLRRSGERGFSLVEVTLSLAIVSTVMVGVVGMLSTGVNLVGEAGDISTQGRIAQKLVGELQLSDWDKLEEYTTPDQRYRYYDYQGQEVEDINDSMQVYTALISIDTTGVALPGSPRPSSCLRRVYIFISPNNGEKGKQDVDRVAEAAEGLQASGQNIENPGELEEVTIHSRILVKMNSSEVL
ncbi:MAG: Verru_Chthon cassette protein B [Verrucomicrobiales bacterium]|nr:Verru_Chthon cassette protein B [Verrucomicrobiales bacterium]